MTKLDKISYNSLLKESVDLIDDYISEASAVDVIGSASEVDIDKIKKDATKMIIAIVAITILVKTISETVKKSETTAEKETTSKNNQQKIKARKSLNEKSVDSFLDFLLDTKQSAQSLVAECSREKSMLKKEKEERRKLIEKMGMQDDPVAKKKLAELDKAYEKRCKEFNDSYKKCSDSYKKAKSQAKIHIATYGSESDLDKFNAIINS